MKIGMLKEYPEYIDTTVKWLNDEFGDNNSINFYRGIIEHSLVDDNLPITFVATKDGILIGTVGIWRGDLLSRQELFPWLSALIVNQNYRNKGVGEKLQNNVLNYCKLKGYKEIFLYTNLIDYYEKNGWISFDKGYEYMGSEVCIYKHSL